MILSPAVHAVYAVGSVDDLILNASGKLGSVEERILQTRRGNQPRFRIGGSVNASAIQGSENHCRAVAKSLPRRLYHQTSSLVSSTDVRAALARINSHSHARNA